MVAEDGEEDEREAANRALMLAVSSGAETISRAKNRVIPDQVRQFRSKVCFVL